MVPIADSSTTEASCIALGYIWISENDNTCATLMTTTASGAITDPGTGDVIVAGKWASLFWNHNIAGPFRISLYHENQLVFQHIYVDY